CSSDQHFNQRKAFILVPVHKPCALLRNLAEVVEKVLAIDDVAEPLSFARRKAVQLNWPSSNL
ncbi:hypothetical protein SB912_29505, partial [Pantoea sp. SIMBA_072]